MIESLLKFLLSVVFAYSCVNGECPLEISSKGLNVTWPATATAINVKSNPVCYNKDNDIVTRNCSDTEWIPPLKKLSACINTKPSDFLDLEPCPPGFYKISENNSEYCFEVSASSAWDYPCFKSGGASVITDFNANELDSLYTSLEKLQISKFFWLPASRQKLFNPLVWAIPGPNWAKSIEANRALPMISSLFKNCLMLDIENRILVTESCSNEYPSLCFYINELIYPAKCPRGYHAFRFMPDDGTCLGIEKSDSEVGSTFDHFIETKCSKTIDDKFESDWTRYIFMNMAMFANLSEHEWCWYKSALLEDKNNESHSNFKQVIKSDGALTVMNSLANLTCMACETEMTYESPELIFAYNPTEMKMYLTIYYESGLWKYDESDKGIRCMSDARGFVQTIDIFDIPFIKFTEIHNDSCNSSASDKIVYVIDLISDRMGQYWCEAHTKNFTLITTDKLVVNPQGNKEHVFVLTVKIFLNQYHTDFSYTYFDEVASEITNTFGATKVLVMDILEVSDEFVVLLLHLHNSLDTCIEDESIQIENTLHYLKEKAILDNFNLNFTYENISSALYCLPTTSEDIFTLEWELTQIGHITAPIQFCLQSNGLPVKRRCLGSYLSGGYWGPVEGSCVKNYEPSNTTTFLYNFAKCKTCSNYTANFLTDGLSFVLEDVDQIIPADIYYLSMSLQLITCAAQENKSSIDTGDLKNIAWAMDRLMDMNSSYLNLAQTLNSTNIILDSISDIIELIATNNETIVAKSDEKYYKLAVEPQFLVQVTFPYINNITGLALVNNNNADSFIDMIAKPLYKNTSIEDIYELEDFVVAAWIPEIVLESLRYDENDSSIDNSNENKKGILIVVNVYRSDVVFQEVDEKYNHSVASPVIEISIPGFQSNLEYFIPIVFRNNYNNTQRQKFCGYWDFSNHLVNGELGYWRRSGCVLGSQSPNFTICHCSHLTHFAQLITFDSGKPKEEKDIDLNHSRALNIITLIGSFMSLLGISGIWLTAITFHNWRKKVGTKVLLQLSTAIALPLIFMIIFNFDNYIFVTSDGTCVIVARHMEGLCIALGAALHYSILAGFMWMLITAVLQFIRYVKVFGVHRPSRFMIKLSLLGWGTPLIPVITMLAINKENYLPTPAKIDSYTNPICYPNGINLVLGVLLPIALILIVNLVLFLLIIYSISMGPDGKIRKSDLDLIKAQSRLSVFLFFLLGLTWIFGIFSFSNNLTWSYLFCLTSTLQGFVLFLYFVVCDPATRGLWVTLMKPQFYANSARASISSSTPS